MIELGNVSRRKAAMAIAGTLAASGTSAAVSLGSGFAAGEARLGRADNGHQHILGLLEHVRHARGSAAVAKAFDRCKAALQLHEVCAASLIASGPNSRDTGDSDAALYRYAEPSAVLAKVIVRELDVLPKNDTGWMRRFGDLETAFQEHVQTATSIQRAT